MKRASLAILGLAAGCSWGTFDDLAATTPLHAQEKPDSVKAADYAIAIAGGTDAASSQGGTLAVLSAGTGNYSTIVYDASGGTTLGDSESLDQHTISSLSANALLASDGTGQAALVDNSGGGPLVVVHGAASGLSADVPLPTSQKPDAITFGGGAIIVTAAPQTSGGETVFLIRDAGVTSCVVNDTMGVPLSAAAIAADDTHLWVWTKTGYFIGYSLTALSGCGIGSITPTVGGVVTSAPSNGGHLDLAANKLAILTTFDSPTTQVGVVTIIDLTASAIVGTPTPAHGVRSATYASFDGMGGVVLGYPDRAGAADHAGAVDVHLLDLGTGALGAMPEQTLGDTHADANLSFGRALTTMLYNGKAIIVVSATNVIYAYYQTLLYTKR